MTESRLNKSKDVEEAAALRLVLADVDASIRQSASTAVPIALLLAAIYWPWANRRGTVVAVALISLAMLPYYVWDRRRRLDQAALSIRRLAVLNSLGCMAWGAAPLLMMPDVLEAQYYLVAIAFAIMVANIADSAALRPIYLAGQIPMIVILTIGFSVAADGPAKFLSIPIVLAAAYLDNVARSWSNKALESARLRVQNERLVSELRDANEVLRHRSTHDHLTGLPNRAAFSSYLCDALADMQHGTDRRTAVMLIDLDGFKSVNDNFGHQAGDQLLVAVASRLRMCTPEEAIVARFGGDELAIAWTGSPTRDDVSLLATTINEVMREPIQVAAGDVQITASIGVILNHSPAVTEAQLLRQADIALYAAKEEGKDRYAFFQSDLLGIENLGFESSPSELVR